MKTRILDTSITESTQLKDPHALLLAIVLVSGAKIEHLPIYEYPSPILCFHTRLTMEQLEEAKPKLAAIGITFEDDWVIIDNEYARFNYTSDRVDRYVEAQIRSLPKHLQEKLLTISRIQEKIGRTGSTNRRTGEMVAPRDIRQIITGEVPSQEREVEHEVRPLGRSPEPVYGPGPEESLNPSTPESELTTEQVSLMAERARAAIRLKPHAKANGKAHVDEEVPF